MLVIEQSRFRSTRTFLFFTHVHTHTHTDALPDTDTVGFANIAMKFVNWLTPNTLGTHFPSRWMCQVAWREQCRFQSNAFPVAWSDLPVLFAKKAEWMRGYHIQSQCLWQVVPHKLHWLLYLWLYSIQFWTFYSHTSAFLSSVVGVVMTEWLHDARPNLFMKWWSLWYGNPVLKWHLHVSFVMFYMLFRLRMNQGTLLGAVQMQAIQMVMLAVLTTSAVYIVKPPRFAQLFLIVFVLLRVESFCSWY